MGLGPLEAPIFGLNALSFIHFIFIKFYLDSARFYSFIFFLFID